MFPKEVQKRLGLINDGLFEVSRDCLHLIEKNNAGAADLKLELGHPCILFRDLENRKLQYFKNQMCSDFVIFEYRNGGWVLHIFELKRSVGKKEWNRIKKQFMGALQNALALAGVLDIHISLEHVHVYTAFRNDKLNQYMNPARLRRKMYEKPRMEQNEEQEEWNHKKIIVDFMGEKEFEHQKIKLAADTGTGSYQIG